MSNQDQVQMPASCAALAATLIVEGCLPMIAGNVQGKAPIAPVHVHKETREKMGIKGTGVLLFYAAGDEGVYFDTGKTEFKLWFEGKDTPFATPLLHDLLMKAFPQAQQLDDVAHPADPRMRARVYRVDLGNGRLAAIETSFDVSGTGKNRFVAKIIAQQRRPN